MCPLALSAWFHGLPMCDRRFGGKTPELHQLPWVVCLHQLRAKSFSLGLSLWATTVLQGTTCRSNQNEAIGSGPWYRHPAKSVPYLFLNEQRSPSRMLASWLGIPFNKLVSSSSLQEIGELDLLPIYVSEVSPPKLNNPNHLLSTWSKPQLRGTPIRNTS